MIGLAVLLGLYLGGMVAFAALVGGVIILVFLRWLMERHVGGITGDTIGAAVEVTEAALLLIGVFALTVQG
jgi:adenosylcobinamide-GDP ribazoletransferase